MLELLPVLELGWAPPSASAWALGLASASALEGALELPPVLVLVSAWASARGAALELPPVPVSV